MIGPDSKAIVVGASSGIGAALVAQLARRGARVAVIARRAEELDRLAGRINRPGARARVLTYPHDVTSYGDVPALFQRICNDLGGLDAIYYVAGVMPRIAVDEYSFEKDRQMIEVNVLGAIAWLNEAARRFERARSGRIVGVSSIAGDRGRRGNPVYCTSKAAMDTYLEALHNRLGRYGVGVTTIKPGFVATAMTEGLPGLFWVIPPARAAQLILRAADRRARVAYVPERWRAVGLVVRAIPSPIFKYLSI